MAQPFEMPKLGLTMEEGTIVAWLVSDGAEVHQGMAVLTIETDKVSSDVEASGSGRLQITAAAGDTFTCGERIGWLLDPGEEAVPDAASSSPTTAERPGSTSVAATARPAPTPSRGTGANHGGRLFASPNARRVAARHGIDLTVLVGRGPDGRIVSEDVLEAAAHPAPSASFAAQQLAARLGVDLRQVHASGPDPRIGRTDVERFVREQLASTRATTAPHAAPMPPPPSEAPLLQTPASTIAMTGMRGTIAGRMHASLQEMAQLTLTMDVVMDAVVAHRSATDPPERAGYTDYVVLAAARALRDHPIVNSQISGGQLALLPEIHVGMAVAIDGGLVVPVVQRADTRSLADLARETTRLATAARQGTLARPDIEGGTFSVTALGMYGVDAFTPVINPPNTAILGVGRLRSDLRWDGDAPVKTTVLTLSLTWDHRAFDGAPAAEFTAAVRNNLENWGQPT